jgi:hypothetical protein
MHPKSRRFASHDDVHHGHKLLAAPDSLPIRTDCLQASQAAPFAANAAGKTFNFH